MLKNIFFYLEPKKNEQCYLGKCCNKIIQKPIDCLNMTIDDVIINENYESRDIKSSEELRGYTTVYYFFNI